MKMTDWEVWQKLNELETLANQYNKEARERDLFKKPFVEWNQFPKETKHIEE